MTGRARHRKGMRSLFAVAGTLAAVLAASFGLAVVALSALDAMEHYDYGTKP